MTLGSTSVEERFVGWLRSSIENAIEANGPDWAASKLELSQPGLEAVLWNPDWSVGMAVHIAGVLEVLTEADLERLEESTA